MARDAALENERLARVEAFEATVISAGQAMHSGDMARTQFVLDQVHEPERNHWWRVARAVASTRFDTPTRTGRLRWNRDQTLASVVRNTGIEIRDPESFEILRTRLAPEEMIFRRLRWTAHPQRFILTYSYVENGEPKSKIFTRLYDADTLEPLGPEIQASHVPVVAGDRTVVMSRRRGDVASFESIDLLTGETLHTRELDTEHGSDGYAEPTTRWLRNQKETAAGVLRLYSSPDFEREIEINERTPRIHRPFSPDQHIALRKSGGIVECWWINDEGVPAFGWAMPFRDPRSRRSFGTVWS